MAFWVRLPVMLLAAKSPVIVYVARDPVVAGLTTTFTPAVPAAVIVYDGALAATKSIEVATVKLVYVPAGGFEMPAIVTVIASPALMWLDMNAARPERSADGGPSNSRDRVGDDVPTTSRVSDQDAAYAGEAAIGLGDGNRR